MVMMEGEDRPDVADLELEQQLAEEAALIEQQEAAALMAGEHEDEAEFFDPEAELAASDGFDEFADDDQVADEVDEAISTPDAGLSAPPEQAPPSTPVSPAPVANSRRADTIATPRSQVGHDTGTTRDLGVDPVAGGARSELTPKFDDLADNGLFGVFFDMALSDFDERMSASGEWELEVNVRKYVRDVHIKAGIDTTDDARSRSEPVISYTRRSPGYVGGVHTSEIPEVLTSTERDVVGIGTGVRPAPGPPERIDMVTADLAVAEPVTDVAPPPSENTSTTTPQPSRHTTTSQQPWTPESVMVYGLDDTTTEHTHTHTERSLIMTEPMEITAPTESATLPPRVVGVLEQWQGLSRLERTLVADRLGLITRADAGEQLDKLTAMVIADTGERDEVEKGLRAQIQTLTTELDEAREDIAMLSDPGVVEPVATSGVEDEAEEEPGNDAGETDIDGGSDGEADIEVDDGLADEDNDDVDVSDAPVDGEG